MNWRILRRTLVLSVVLAVVIAAPAFAVTSHGNGVGTQIPAFYDGKVFTITFMELSPKAEATTLAKNKSINIIYQSDQAEAAGVEFGNVLDAIPGDGFNPLWNEVQVVFNAGHAPRQLTSDTDILAARDAGEVTLEPTTEMYICAVVGHKK